MDQIIQSMIDEIAMGKFGSEPEPTRTGLKVQFKQMVRTELNLWFSSRFMADWENENLFKPVRMGSN
jgi:hypothetical protein